MEKTSLNFIHDAHVRALQKHISEFSDDASFNANTF